MRTERTVGKEQAIMDDKAMFVAIVKDARRFPEICRAICSDDNKLYDDNARAASHQHDADNHKFYYRWEKKDNHMISFDFASINSYGNLFAKHLTVSEKLAKRALAEIELVAKVI